MPGRARKTLQKDWETPYSTNKARSSGVGKRQVSRLPKSA